MNTSAVLSNSSSCKSLRLFYFVKLKLDMANSVLNSDW